MYFSATTMITVGYGDFSPVHQLEKLFGIIFMLISCIQLSYSVSTIGSIIEEIRIDQEENKRKLRLITSFMEKKGTTAALQRRLAYANLILLFSVREYLLYFWKEQEEEN